MNVISEQHWTRLGWVADSLEKRTYIGCREFEDELEKGVIETYVLQTN